MANREHLDRVSDRIAGAITAFLASRDTFTADELRRAVRERCGEVAPGSPDRVLRDLRQRGVVAYEVVSRKASLYRVIRLGEQLGLGL